MIVGVRRSRRKKRYFNANNLTGLSRKALALAMGSVKLNNETIKSSIGDIETYVAELNDTKKNLEVSHKYNTNVIGKLSNFIGTDVVCE